MQFSQGEIQQLQEVLRVELFEKVLDKKYCISNAKWHSKMGNKVATTGWYAAAENQQKKINKLAELQRKLKRTKWSLVEVDPWFFGEDIDENMEM